MSRVAPLVPGGELLTGHLRATSADPLGLLERARETSGDVARRAQADDVMGGWQVPAGAFVFVSAWVTHRDPRDWEERLAFRPERFAPDRPAPDRYVYFPFSQGQRKCIGDRFAEMEASLILPVRARRFRFRPVAGHPIAPEPSITLRPRDGLPMTLERRCPP